MKKCPHCAEDVDDEAVKCCHCGGRLAEPTQEEQAFSVYELIVSKDTENILAYQQMADIAERVGDIPKAINARLRMAQLLDSRGQYDKALQVYDRVLSMDDPGRPGAEKAGELLKQCRTEIFVQMGRIMLCTNQAADALRVLKTAVESSLGAQDVRVHTLLGLAYIAQMMDTEAIEAFKEVVRLAPDQAAFAYERIAETLSRLATPVPSYWRSAGDQYLHHEQWSDAIRAYETFLTLEPGNQDVMGRLEIAKRNLG